MDQLNSDGQVALWNDDCGQYVASYTVGNATRQIWFEEEKSIEAKMQVIQGNNVAGVAGWKLGLEKSSVWPVISFFWHNNSETCNSLLIYYRRFMHITFIYYIC